MCLFLLGGEPSRFQGRLLKLRSSCEIKINMKVVKRWNRTEIFNDKDELHSFNDNPAVTTIGTKQWYKEGKRHRLDGPAIISANRYKYWYQNGKQHRLDGPAVEIDEYKLWYYKGKLIECNNSTEKFLKIINLKAFW